MGTGPNSQPPPVTGNGRVSQVIALVGSVAGVVLSIVGAGAAALEGPQLLTLLLCTGAGASALVVALTIALRDRGPPTA